MNRPRPSYELIARLSSDFQGKKPADKQTLYRRMDTAISNTARSTGLDGKMHKLCADSNSGLVIYLSDSRQPLETVRRTILERGLSAHGVSGYSLNIHPRSPTNGYRPTRSSPTHFGTIMANLVEKEAERQRIQSEQLPLYQAIMRQREESRRPPRP